MPERPCTEPEGLSIFPALGKDHLSPALPWWAALMVPESQGHESSLIRRESAGGPLWGQERGPEPSTRGTSVLALLPQRTGCSQHTASTPHPMLCNWQQLDGWVPVCQGKLHPQCIGAAIQGSTPFILTLGSHTEELRDHSSGTWGSDVMLGIHPGPAVCKARVSPSPAVL